MVVIIVYQIKNHMDLCMKYAFLNLGKYVHDFFELPGNYNFNAGTEVITCEKRNLRMDVAYFSDKNLINNIENQSKPVDFEKLSAIAEYAKFILIYNNALVNTIVITKVDPKYCLKEISLTRSLILRPYYIYMSPEEILKLLNMIKDKIDNNEKLTYRDTIALALIPTLAQDHIAEKVTEEVCHLIEKYQFNDNNLRSNICFIIDVMIDRNIRDKNKQKELREELNMEETRTIIRKLIEEENKDALKEKDRIIEEKNKELEEKDRKLENINSIINNKNIDEKAKVNVLSSLIIAK